MRMSPDFGASLEKRTVELLRASMERFRALVENSSEAIFLSDEQGNIVYASPSLTRVLGYDADERLGCCGTDLVHPQDLADVQAMFDAALAQPGRQFPFACRVRHKNGSWRHVDGVCTNHLHTPSVQAVVANFRDVTQFKWAEIELRRSEERFRAIVAEVPECVKLVAADGLLIDMNPAGLAMIQAPSLEAVKGRCVFDLIAADDRERYRMFHAQVCSGQPGTLEFDMHTLAGARRQMQSHAVPFHWEADGGVVSLAITQDVTDRRQAEEGRRQLEAKVRRAEKLESLAALAGGVAHDFNNLLTAILGNASLALLKTSPQHEIEPMLRDIVHASRRAVELAQQMLAYSGRGKFVVQPLRLDDIVQGMAGLLGRVISNKADLRLKLEPVTIQGDEKQIRQVILNLVANASDALEDRAGAITIRTGLCQADSAALHTPYLADDLPPGRYVFVEVADNGLGMDSETLARIFDPFFTTKFTGRGLGLAAVLGIVRGHHGTVRVDSAPGAGAVFQLLFPPADGAPTAEPAGQPAAAASRGGTVLVVEDEPAVRKMARRALELAGYQVREAGDGESGLELYAQCAGDIVAVLLDLTMPRMDGLELLERLRAMGLGAPVLVMSGYTEGDLTGRLLASGATGFLQKPFAASDLLARLGDVLQCPAGVTMHQAPHPAANASHPATAPSR